MAISFYWHSGGELRQWIFRLGQPWPWSRIGGKNRGIFGHGNSWERWAIWAGEIERMFGKSGNGNRWKGWGKLGLEIHARNPIRGLGFLLVWSPSILSAFPTKQLGFIHRGLIPCTPLGFPTWGNGSTLTKSHFPKKIFRNSRYFSGHSCTKSGIIYL